MKQKRFISILLAVILVISVLPPVPAAASAVPSSWAVPEVNDANTSGLLTSAAAEDYRRALTRDEFCELVVLLAERTLGRELPVPDVNPFTDSESIYVQKANKYGIIYGIGDNKFDPNGKVERQQLCAMITRAITQLESDMGRAFLSAPASIPFKDVNTIDSYAVDPVKIAYANNIMLGDDQGNFNPKSGITSEECVAVIIRAFNSIQNTLITSRSPAQVADMIYDRLEIGFAHGDAAGGVSRDIILQTSVPGGATVKWTSSNESVISSTGAVNPPKTPVTVTLSAAITVSGASRTKVFTLTTTQSTGDKLFVENAYNELDIIYTKDGDGPDSVTGRIGLPSSVLGVPVTWSTSASSVITRTGQVYVPSGSDVRVVTLTATLMKGAQVKTKTFTLRVSNPLYTNRSVSLNGIELGMTAAQAATVLGSPRRTVQTASNESWSTYHDGYNNFVAVAFSGSKAVAVYSMVSNAASKLLDASKNVITAEEVNQLSNVKAVQYGETTGTGTTAATVYAIMIYDATSAIGQERALYSDGQEQLLFDLINAYRYRNSRTPLEWNSKLAASARSHSTEMGSYNFLSATSRNGYSFVDRAVTQGYESKLFLTGNVHGGAVDAVDALNLMVSATQSRTDMLNASATVFGAGFTSGYTGQYRTYLTCAYGTLRAITSVTSTPAPVSLSAGASLKVTLNLLPTGYNESIKWSSSNNNIFTMSGTEGDKAPTITGVAAGNASIYVTGVSSGNTYTIPVSVGTSYATDLTLKYGATTLTNDSTALLGCGDTMQLTATPSPTTGSVVTWTSSNTNIATVNSQGLVTASGTATGTVTITARVYSSATTQISRILTVYVDNLTLSHQSAPLYPGGNITLSLDATGSKTTTVEPKLAVSSSFSCTWSSSNVNVATAVKDPNSQNGILTAVNTGPVTVSVTATRTGTTVGAITKSFYVTVMATSYATNLVLNPSVVELEVGQSRKIETTIVPSVVEKNTITWTSSDTSVATVDNAGNIVALKEGTVTIFASMLQDGAPMIKSVSVTVSARTIPVTAITIVGPAALTVGTPQVYTVALTPSNATNQQISWSSSDTQTATVSQNGTVTFLKAGTIMLAAYSNENSAIQGTMIISAS